MITFLKHDDARRLKRNDVIKWKDELLLTLAPKTVRDAHMSALKAILQWGVDAGRLETNVSENVRVKVPARAQGRERGLTDDEAIAVLGACLDRKRSHGKTSQPSENPYTFAAKRWIPWLCAFTGARVAEIAQLRKEDVRTSQGVRYMRLTPDADSVKTEIYRDIPLHLQLLKLGFGDVVGAAGEGPLFFDGGSLRVGRQHPSKHVAQLIAMWVRSLDLISKDVDPNHGWRHRMKTVARDLGLDMHVVDAIQGHAARTAGERYGDVSLSALDHAMQRFPRFDAKASP